MVQAQAEGLEASVQELQVRLDRAQEDLSLKKQTIEGLTQKFDRYSLISLYTLDACFPDFGSLVFLQLVNQLELSSSWIHKDYSGMVCRGAVVLGDADAKLAEKQVALAAAKAQLASHDKHLTSQDATIKGILRKQVSFLPLTQLMCTQRCCCTQGTYSWHCRASRKVLERRF